MELSVVTNDLNLLPVRFSMAELTDSRPVLETVAVVRKDEVSVRAVLVR